MQVKTHERGSSETVPNTKRKFGTDFKTSRNQKSVHQVNDKTERKLMTTLTRWSPFREMDDLQSRLNSILGLSSNRRQDSNESFKIPDWTPLVDISEDEKEFVIKVELPELKKEEVTVKVEDGVLTISGERKLEQENQARRFHRVERVYGRFARSFRIPEEADPEKVSAGFKDGVLAVRLPKDERTQKKAVEVKIN